MAKKRVTDPSSRVGGRVAQSASRSARHQLSTLSSLPSHPSSSYLPTPASPSVILSPLIDSEYTSLMGSLNGSSLWDYPIPPSLPALADEDFITLLQKQFGANNGFAEVDNFNDKKDDAQPQTANINPQNLTRLPIPKPVESPPSDDSSPSPNEASSSRSRRESGIFDVEGFSRGSEEVGDDDPTLKRKASAEDMDDEPSHKTQHTCSSLSIYSLLVYRA